MREKQNMMKDAAISGDWDRRQANKKREIAEGEKFIQSWLFFVFLDEFFSLKEGFEFNLEDFVSSRRLMKEDGVVSNLTFNTTYDLPNYLSLLGDALSNKEENVVLEFCKQRGALLGEINVIVYDYLVFPMQDIRQDDNTFNKIVLSIIVLGETLSTFTGSLLKNRDFRNSSVASKLEGNLRELEWPDNGVLKTLMTSEPYGWCSSIATMLEDGFSVTALLMAFSLQRPREDGKHEVCLRNLDFASHVCRAHNVDESTYQTRHSGWFCECTIIGSDVDELIRILERGEIPVMEVTPIADDEDNFILKCISSTERPFVAISHVWRDGLGNSKGNFLPKCDIRELYHRVRNIPGNDSRTVVFWLDTLCIPRCDEDARKLAIERIRPTFATAKHVLVIDSCIQEFSISQTVLDIILLRIVCSPWMRRLWTLEEAILSRPGALKFQFADGVFELQDIVTSSKFTSYYKTYSPIKEQFIRLFRPFTSFRDNMGEAERVQTVMNLLQHRSASRSHDEFPCIATLLGISPLGSDGKLVTSYTPLLDRIHEYPVEILFTPLERFDEDGLRWAPTTLLRSESITWEHRISRFSGITGRKSQHGFHVRLPSISLSYTRLHIMFPTFWVKNESDGTYWTAYENGLRGTSSVGVKRTAGAWYKKTSTGKLDYRIPEPRLIRNAHIILESDEAFRKRQQWKKYYGILTSVEKEENGVLFARYERLLTLREEQRPQILSLLASVYENEKQNATDGDFTYNTWGKLELGAQDWCIF